MHRSSPSIAGLAAALAKAQAELVNPEKSLVATISSGHRGGREQGTVRNLVCEAMMMRIEGASYGDRERATGPASGRP